MNTHRYFFTLTTLVTTLVLAACNGQAAPSAAPTPPPAPVTEATTEAEPSAVAPTTPPAAPPEATTAATEAAAPPEATVAATTPEAEPSPPAATVPDSQPVFSNPTEITNPFFPISVLSHTVMIGIEGGELARSETMLLPELKTITWPGGEIQARVIQFASYGDGKLLEIAYDYLAQADNGDVYYFGEDVFNYQDGKVINQDGAWLAGKDGAPPALIMPAKPEVGMVFNPENLPGVVFETDEVLSLSEKAMTPSGPISDGMLIKETLMDGAIERKIYAAGFGVVEDSDAEGSAQLVLALRTDAAPRAVPDPLQAIEVQTEAIFTAVPDGDWARVGEAITAIADAWKSYQPQATADEAPQVFQEALTSAFEALQQAAKDEDAPETLQTANDLSAAVVDLISVYQPVEPADLGRLDVLERQLMLDVAAGEISAATDILAQLDGIWARLKPFVLPQGGVAAADKYDASLSAQRAALEKGDGAALTHEIKLALELIDELEKGY